MRKPLPTGPYRTFEARVTAPSGYEDTYRVQARSKTEARAEIARLYRRDTPSARNGFYSFGQCRLAWIEGGE